MPEKVSREVTSSQQPGPQKATDFSLTQEGDETKTFVLDTNVLLHNPGSLFAFKDNRVVLALAVIEELDRFKRANDELGRNAREAIRAIDSHRELGSLGEGVPMKNGGTLQVVLHQDVKGEIVMLGLKPEAADNQIISVGLALKRKGHRVTFVSKDINARVKADALGLRVEDFEQQKVDFDSLYTGWREILVPAEVVNAFYAEKAVPLPDSAQNLAPNEFVLLKDETNPKHTALTRTDLVGKELVPLIQEYDRAWNIAPRSATQRMAFELLLDDNIQLVTLVGRAGTGKTLMAIAAGLHRIIKDKRYEKMLVSRPIMPLGRDIGYLPGDKDEKLTAWMGPIFDNLKYLLHGRYTPSPVTKEQLFEQDLIELEALTYIRGRSIANMFVVVDEAQNLTPHEVKTIISRVGEGTKMILTGDPQQIDNPYLDASSNGLTYCVERMKSASICGHMMLMKSERSQLADLAAERL
ncbi:MAG TPA: PhoH family protein [Planctomycetota bacterium]|nr:PhoH family protein [Planctomycetota bacterium]